MHKHTQNHTLGDCEGLLPDCNSLALCDGELLMLIYVSLMARVHLVI